MSLSWISQQSKLLYVVNKELRRILLAKPILAKEKSQTSVPVTVFSASSWGRLEKPGRAYVTQDTKRLSKIGQSEFCYLT
jgi:hypothetical protein